MTDKTLQFTITSVTGLAKLKTKISIEDYLAGEDVSLDKQIEIQSFGLTLNLEEIYNRVRFES